MKITELDKAQLKYELRRIYKEIGMPGCARLLYEWFVAAELLCEVMKEENEKES